MEFPGSSKITDVREIEREKSTDFPMEHQLHKSEPAASASAAELGVLMLIQFY